MVLGLPYEEETGNGTGMCKHVYDENGDEILTYTPGVGWHERSSKAEHQVHSALKFTYYEAYHAAAEAVLPVSDKEQTRYLSYDKNGILNDR